ncbi:MAG TPA: NAD(P)/FAD-dependent oxidoreductase [Pseudonocardia sp.]|jgi:cyclohexanone monooxygenase|nr:NAD(P)/FAD-dependent oxidoreductase [Pseudonocardia sp.]
MTDFDAIVVGAGFSGLRMLHELREQGLSVRVYEAGTDVGGTWYWNRYPGARTDTESWCYAYQFSSELQRDWNWTERFPTQREAHEYLRHVADRFDMRRDIRFETRVTAAHYDEAANTWSVTTDAGDTLTCTYFIPAPGPLSLPYKPDFPGLDDFTGEWVITGNWPKEGVDVAGKRVVCIGTGATAVQVIPIVAKSAGKLTVLQRTPNYVMPARNFPLSDDDRQEIQANYEAIWQQANEHFFAFPMTPSGRRATEHSEEERRKIFEQGWETGGFRFIFETFDDLITDLQANEYASEFVRDKIRSIVNDPETAELLCPKDYPLAGKRPPLGHFYYETFNRPNVELVDVRTNPISGITANGVRTEDGTVHEADVIIFATGFDAVTGSLTSMDIRGRGGVSLAEKWAGGPRTHLGIGVEDFPNMFLVAGPQTSFANLPPVIEGIASWIGGAIRHLRSNGLATMEATPGGTERWVEHVQELVDATVLPHGKNSWFLGDNIPGKPHVVLYYFGGAGAYRRECESVAEAGYQGFALA